MTVESVSHRTCGRSIDCRFLYADYTPVDDDRNIIQMLENFVTLAGKLIKLQTDNDRLSLALCTADTLHQDAKSAISELGSNGASATERFHTRYPDPLITGFHTDCAALLETARKAISDIIGNADSGLANEYKKYKDKIMSQIQDNNATAAFLMQSWLSNDRDNLPSSLLSSVSREMTVTIDAETLKTYDVYRTTSSIKRKGRNAGQRKEKNANRVSYKFRIDTSDLEFWSSSRKVADLGLKDLMLPIGMEAPISEKLRKALSFNSRKDDLVEEPKFVKVDDYYILNATLDGERSLVVQLVPDIAKADIELIEISFDFERVERSTNDDSGPNEFDVAPYPKINYRTKANGQHLEVKDLLSIKEIAKASDLSKITLLGKSVLSKSKILEQAMRDSRGKLKLLKMDDIDVLNSNEKANVEFTPLFDLLHFVASSFSPLVTCLMERTPVKGELILREQVEEGQRREFSVKLDHLKSQLSSDHHYGKLISETLRL